MDFSPKKIKCGKSEMAQTRAKHKEFYEFLDEEIEISDEEFTWEIVTI